MRIASPEIKVGAFTLIALVAMFGLAFWFNGFHFFQPSHEVEAEFPRVEGLRPGAPVKFAGVDIGRVTKVYFDDFKVIVGMNIDPVFKIPPGAKAIISTAGVVGDVFVELIPPKPGEKIITLKKHRLIGQTPVTMEQFSAIAYDVLYSLEQITDSIKEITDNQAVMGSLKESLIRLNAITANIEQVTSQFKQIDLAQLFDKLDHTAAIVEQLAVNNQPQINKLILDITQASVQLTQASISANDFLKKIDNNGQTATDLQQTLAQANKIADNLEKFSEILANKGKDIDQLLNRANQTMESINQAAQNINNAVSELTTGDNNSIQQVKKIIANTNQATEQISQSVNTLSQLSLKSRVGLEYQPQQPVKADLMLDLSFDKQNSLYLGVEDIGNENLTTLQWGFKGPVMIGRVGLYKNQFGLGLDYTATPGWNLGLDLWNTHSPNVGLSSTVNLTRNWSLTVGGSSDLSNQTFTWNLEGWYGL